MAVSIQTHLFDSGSKVVGEPPKGQLLKWIGSKQRVAAEIVTYFPQRFGAFHEPFLGSGAVLATLAPSAGYGSDIFAPLVDIWETLRRHPAVLKGWYAERWELMRRGGKAEAYDQIKASYNSSPNAADLLFLCRACYGGVVRFRKADGYMSTPCGAHTPISPVSFNHRVDMWHRRVLGTSFEVLPYELSMNRAVAGDLVYCDPPYSHSQAILYGAQGFSIEALLESIEQCKRRGVFVALSIDGTKKSGKTACALPIPRGLFEREVFVRTGRSMLRRFQMSGESLEGEQVSDRLLLTY